MTEPVKTVAVTQQASSRAATFLNSLGVNTHLSWWDTSWGVGNGQWAGAESKVVAELTYLDDRPGGDAGRGAGLHHRL